ncbi:MAG: PD-(D/E)XK nuclease family protein [Candidatus Omnitrophota bacterium]
MFDPKNVAPFKLSRTKIDLFLSCQRCFYLDRRLGVGQPPGYPFSLNSAVDALLKKEFDTYRKNKTAHPLMKTFGVNAIPFQHEKLDEWRDALRKGVSYLHKSTNFIVTGAIDDVWVTPEGELLIVDYKSTSKKEEVNLDAEWQISYKRQMELYQWLFRRNEFKVSEIGYFVYCNGQSGKEAFANKLEFDVKIIPYKGDDAWVEPTLINARKCLDADTIPEANPECDFCRYHELVKEAEKDTK